jgi:hypothetical protein
MPTNKRALRRLSFGGRAPTGILLLFTPTTLILLPV